MTKGDAQEVANLQKLSLTILSLVGGTTILLIIFFSLSTIKENIFVPKAFFPLDDPMAAYTLVKTDDLYWVVYDTPIASDSTKLSHAAILVGKSQVDLDPYLGKIVRLKGHFNPFFQTQQCILGNCHTFAGKQQAVVIDIESIN